MNLFSRNIVGEQAYQNAKFIKLEYISGERKLYGMLNYNGAERALIFTEKTQ
jgi:hypothetical protein